MNSIATIRTTLKTLIETNLTGVESFYDFARASFEDYPSGYIIFDGCESEPRSNNNRLFTYRFKVRIFIEQGTNFEASKSERLANTLSDDLIYIINNNITLNQSVLEVRPISISAAYEVAEVDARVIDCTLEVRKLEAITN